MRTRESGMPEEPVWSSFFDPKSTLRTLGLRPKSGDVVDFGCGYGTFTIPAAGIVRGTVYAYDVDPAMVAATESHAEAGGLNNVKARQRDLMADGTGLPNDSVGYALLFNILHCESPGVLLREAWRVLAPGRRLAIMHWNFDPSTPRGPSMSIRPRPEQCRAWAIETGFELAEPDPVALPPYHYGLLFRKPAC